MSELMEAFVKIRADNDQLRRDLGGMQGMIRDRLSVGAQAAGVAVGSLIAAGIQTSIRAGLGAIRLGGSMIEMASDAEETAAKFETLLGGAAASTRAQLNSFASAAGRSRFELEKMSADLAALISPMGFSEQKTSEMSVALVKLATDLASFNNVAESDALVAIRAGLVGESEPLRRFGVQLSESRVRAQALAMGLGSLKGPLSATDKAAAVMALVMKDTAAAQGDAIRTSDSYANSVRRLKAGLTDTATTMGAALLPAMTSLVGVVGEIGTAFEGVATGASPILKAAIEGIAATFDEASLSIAAWPQTVELIKTSFLLRLVQMRDAAMQFWENLKAGAVGVVAGFGAAFKTIFSEWRTLVQDMLDVFLAMAGGLGDALAAAFSGEGLSGMRDAFTAAVGEAADEALTQFGKVGGAFKDSFNSKMAGAAQLGPSAEATALQRELDRIADARIATRQRQRDERAAGIAEAATAGGGGGGGTGTPRLAIDIPFFGEASFKEPLEKLGKQFAEVMGKVNLAPGAIAGGLSSAATFFGSDRLASDGGEEQRAQFVNLAEMNRRIQEGLTPRDKNDAKKVDLLKELVVNIKGGLKIKDMPRMPAATVA